MSLILRWSGRAAAGLILLALAATALLLLLLCVTLLGVVERGLGGRQ